MAKTGKRTSRKTAKRKSKYNRCTKPMGKAKRASWRKNHPNKKHVVRGKGKGAKKICYISR